MPGSPSRPIELRDGVLSAWSEFCAHFASSPKAAAEQGSKPESEPDWLGGTAIKSTAGRKLSVSLNSQPHITEVAAASRRPAVWCIYRVQMVPVLRRSDRAVVGEQAVPVPVSVGVAKRDALTQFPRDGVDAPADTMLWCRGWDDSRPESDKWGTAVSTAAWIVETMNGLNLPKHFWAS